MPAAKKRTTAAISEVPASSQNKKPKAPIEVEFEESSKPESKAPKSVGPLSAKAAGSPPSQQISDSISLKSPFRSGPHASLAAADATLSCLDSLAKTYEKKANDLYKAPSLL